MADGSKYTTFAQAHSMPSSVTNSLNKVSKESESQDPGFERNKARDLGEGKIS